VTIPALLIFPSDPQWIPENSDDLADLLHETGLSGPALQDAALQRYRAGERFLDHVSFLGCSPRIELEPTADGKSFCHIRLAVHRDGPRLIRGATRRPPRCPHCGSSQNEWSVDGQRAPWRCASCSSELTAETLDWGRAGGAARCFVIVGNVFPSEAVPGSELLSILAAATGVRWDYFYAEVEE
jgi:hypothetical protein